MNTDISSEKWEYEFGHGQMSTGVRYWQVHDGMHAVCHNQFCYAAFGDEAKSERYARLIASAPTLAAEDERLRALNAQLMGGDESAPRYTTKRLRHEVEERTQALAAEIASLKADLAAAEQARAVAEVNLELRSMSNVGLRQLIGEMVEGLDAALRHMPIGYAATGRPGGADERNAALVRDKDAIRNLIARAKGAAS